MADTFKIQIGVSSSSITIQVGLGVKDIQANTGVDQQFRPAINLAEYTRWTAKISVSDLRRTAHLARISIDENEIRQLSGELNSILRFVDQLQDVDVENVEPMTSVTPMRLRMRKDEVTDGGYAERVLKNAPNSDDNFFVVPKVVE